MSVTYGFYNSVNGDRKYDATQLSSLFDGLINDGVFASIGTCFAVEAAGGNTVNIGIGKAWFNKTWTLNDAILPLEAPVSEVLLDRIDAVVLEVDISERVNSIKFVEGVPSSSPVNPTLASGPTLFQYPLCYIYRPAGSTEITQAQITNMVGSEATPFITGILQTVNLDEWINSRLADYEYQTPIIDGTQIQLQKQSNTKILKFRLDADLSGGAITISLDGGATSKPLVDIDGVAVTKLPKGFVEVVEDAVNFTYAPKGKGASLDLEKVDAVVFSAESESYGGSIRSITSDDNFLYVGGSTTQRVYKLDKSDLSKVSESIDYGGAIYSITSDDDYLYVGGSTTQKVYKLNKSDLSKVAESESYGGSIYSITSDDDYLYVAGSTTQRVYKLNKSDLSKVSESIDYGGAIYSITSDDNFVYVGGYTRKVWKLSKSDLSKVGESESYGNFIQFITSDDNFIYVGGDTRKVWKLSKSDLSKVSESIDYGGTIYSITYDDDYLYVGGGTTQRVWKLDKSDLSKVSESIDYGGSIYSITSDDDYLYVAGSTTQRVWKLTKVVYIHPYAPASLDLKEEMIFSDKSIDYLGTIYSITSDDDYLYVGGFTDNLSDTRAVWKLDKNLNKLAESRDYGGIYSIAVDDNYVYVGGGKRYVGDPNPKVWKLAKSNLNKVRESIEYGIGTEGYIYSIAVDDNYVYIGGSPNQRVWKLNKSDLSKVAESIDYGGTIYSIVSDDNFLYVGGHGSNKVWKLNKSDLSKVSESIDYGGSIRSITSDDNYIYVGGGGTQRVWKLDKSDLSKVGESESYGNFIQSITSDDNFIYVGGNTQKVWKLSKSDLSKVSESIEGYGGTIRSITSDDNFIYVGGYTTRRVRKLAKVGYLYKNLKLIAIGSV